MVDALAHKPFSYTAFKNDSVQIFYAGKLATHLRGKSGSKFLARVGAEDSRDAQHLMARITGQFKLGNERVAKEMGSC